MYVTGGKNVKNHAVATVSCFDPRTKEITLTTDLKVARFGHGLVELNGYLYAFGGYGDDGLRMASVERFDERSQTWEDVPSLRTIRAALGCDALNGKIYVAGGYGKAGDGNNNQQSLVKQVEVCVCVAVAHTVLWPPTVRFVCAVQMGLATWPLVL
eukprot:m.555728 g.555728  ORF g.555728 m.555728 type:complete len:156 (+) comp22184_c0_seq1:2220-2687(+)